MCTIEGPVYFGTCLYCVYKVYKPNFLLDVRFMYSITCLMQHFAGLGVMHCVETTAVMFPPEYSEQSAMLGLFFKTDVA